MGVSLHECVQIMDTDDLLEQVEFAQHIGAVREVPECDIVGVDVTVDCVYDFIVNDHAVRFVGESVISYVDGFKVPFIIVARFDDSSLDELESGYLHCGNASVDFL